MSERFVTDNTCVLCGKQWSFDDVIFTCPDCGDEGILDIGYDYERIASVLTAESLAANPERSLWRYQPLLPIARPELGPNLQVGWTPLYESTVLAGQLELGAVWLKDDGRQPSASLKDRASAVGLARARELERGPICAASTGNAASSLACLGASVGVHPIIFLPRTAPVAKIAQLQVFGAVVLAVEGTYDDAFDLSLHAAREYGWYTRSTAVNPVLAEGKKTVSLEICEQLGWQVPDVIAVSVGDGCIVGGVCKGLLDLHRIGLIPRVPRVLGVQAATSSVLSAAFHAGPDNETITPVSTSTVADSICVDQPRDAIKALRGVRATSGTFVTVEDGAILAAIPELGRASGVFAEPAGATAWAGVKQARADGWIAAGERVAVIVSGNGLKDVASAIKATGDPTVIEPTPAALQAAVTRLGLA